MSSLLLQKVVSVLPGVLTADTVYFVRVGTGFDIYVTNHSGTIVAYPENKTGALDVYGSPLLPLWSNVDVYAVAGGTISQLGLNTTASGTTAIGAFATTNYRSALNQLQYTTGTTTGTAAGFKVTTNTRWRGNAAGLGGFELVARFAPTLLTGHQFQAGLVSLTLAGEPSASGSSISLAADSTDTNLQWLTRDGTNFNKVDTGVARTITDVLRLRILALPNGGTVTASLYDESTGSTLSTATLTLNLPSTITPLAPAVYARNGATTTSAQVDFVRLSIASSTP